MGDYILTWTADNQPYRIDIAVTEEVAALFAAALTDHYTDVTLLRNEVVSSDITESAKAPQAAEKLPADEAPELVPPVEEAPPAK
jgi:hypothetical protein